MCFNVGMSNAEFTHHPDYDPKTEQALQTAAERRQAIERHLNAVPNSVDEDSLTDEQRELHPDLNEKAVQATLEDDEYRRRFARNEIANARDKLAKAKENINQSENPTAHS